MTLLAEDGPGSRVHRTWHRMHCESHDGSDGRGKGRRVTPDLALVPRQRLEGTWRVPDNKLEIEYKEIECNRGDQRIPRRFPSVLG